MHQEGRLVQCCLPLYRHHRYIDYTLNCVINILNHVVLKEPQTFFQKLCWYAISSVCAWLWKITFIPLKREPTRVSTLSPPSKIYVTVPHAFSEMSSLCFIDLLFLSSHRLFRHEAVTTQQAVVSKLIEIIYCVRRFLAPLQSTRARLSCPFIVFFDCKT